MASIRKRRTAHGHNYEVDFVDGAGIRRRLRADTKERAEQLLADKLVEARQALPPDVDREVTLGAYADSWITQQRKNGLAPTTVANYEQMLALYVRPALGRYRVCDLHRQVIRRWLTQLRDRGLSKNTVRLARAALSSLLSDAVEDGILLANPTFGMGRKSKGPHRLSPAERSERIRPLAEAVLQRFLTIAERAEPRYAPFFWTMALEGTRPGEALGLQARNVDVAGLELEIERAVDKTGRVGLPKNGERRAVDLHSRLVPVLKRVIRERKEEALQRGEPWEDSAALFTTRTGQRLDLANVSKAFKRVLRTMTPDGQEPPRHSIYDLRHTFATTLLSKGVPITYVAAQMGHSTAATTLRFYARWLPKKDRRYVDLLLESPVGEPEALAAPGSGTS